MSGPMARGFRIGNPSEGGKSARGGATPLVEAGEVDERLNVLFEEGQGGQLEDG